MPANNGQPLSGPFALAFAGGDGHIPVSVSTPYILEREGKLTMWAINFGGVWLG